MKQFRFAACAFFACVGSVASTPPDSPIQWIERTLHTNNLDQRYELHAWIKPAYLIGDFNGDGHSDAAVLIREKRSGKSGIAIVHWGKNEVFIFGAGKEIGNAGDNFSWMDEWRLETRQGKQEAVFVGKSDSAGGIIYWNANKYKWQQQGD